VRPNPVRELTASVHSLSFPVTRLGFAQEMTPQTVRAADCRLLLSFSPSRETESDCFPLIGILDTLAVRSPRE